MWTRSAHASLEDTCSLWPSKHTGCTRRSQNIGHNKEFYSLAARIINVETKRFVQIAVRLQCEGEIPGHIWLTGNGKVWAGLNHYMIYNRVYSLYPIKYSKVLNNVVRNLWGLSPWQVANDSFSLAIQQIQSIQQRAGGSVKKKCCVVLDED